MPTYPLARAKTASATPQVPGSTRGSRTSQGATARVGALMLRVSRGGHPAGDGESLPEDVARLRRGEEDVGGRELGRLPGPAERGAPAELGEVLGRLPVGGLQRRPDRAGGDGVDPDALGGELLGQTLGE